MKLQNRNTCLSPLKTLEYYNALRFGAIMKPSFMTRSSSRSGMHFEAPLSKQQLLLYFEAGTPPLSSPLFLSSFQLAFASFFTSPMGLRTRAKRRGGFANHQVPRRTYKEMAASTSQHIFLKTISWNIFPAHPLSLHASIHYPGILPPLPFSSGGGKGGAGNSREKGRERNSPTFPSRLSTGKIAIEENTQSSFPEHKYSLTNTLYQ